MAADTPSLDAIFCAAIAMAADDDRAAYIARACGDDLELRGRVEKLVQAHFRAGHLAEQPPHPAAESESIAFPFPEPPVAGALEERPGKVLGPYKLLEQIGEGGFGVVFLAEQTQPLRRRVALKVLKPGMDTRRVVARFEAERQALALMDHPNIARVFDGGATASGRPYFVMELVRGVPFTDYCDQHQLTVKQRLGLFVSVCQAVQHAHQKGIIHRDLKPSNILVAVHECTPAVKVIDFGVAKALGQQLTDKTLYTGFAQLVGTPLYMSPEQAELGGLDVDTRSDIYSLGVVLYELLTGATPFDRKRFLEAGYDEVRRILREEEPPKPSARLSTLGAAAAAVSAQRKSDPRRLSQFCRGELDWIVMKALEKERSRRYETAGAFAADVERYLHDEPVQACPPSRWYRLRKLLRKHRVAALTAAAFVALLLAGAAASTWQAVRATRAEGAARKSAETARAINQFLIEDMFSAARPEEAQGRKVTVEEVLDKAAGNVEDAFPDQPEVEAAVRLAIGEAYYTLALYPKAEPHLRRALELRLGVLGAEHADTLDAMNQLGKLCALQGKYDEAERHYRQALEGLRRLRGNEDRSTLELMHNLAWVLAHNQPDKAEPLFRECFEIKLRVLGEEDPDTLATMGNLAQTINDQGRWREAEPLIRRCLAIKLRVIGENHPDTLYARTFLAEVLQAEGKWREAEPLFRESLEAGRRIQGPNHRETLLVLRDLGIVHLLLGRFADAEEELRQARDGCSRTLGAASEATLNGSSVHALALQACGRLEEAEREARDNLGACRRAKGPEAAVALAALAGLGYVLRARGQWAEAENCLQQAAEGYRRVKGPEHPGTLRVMNSQAEVLLGLGRREDARSLFWQVLDARRRALPPDHPELAESLTSCGEYLLEVGQCQESEPLLEEALKIQRQALPPEHPATGQTLAALGWARSCDGDAAAGERLLREGSTIVRAAFPEGHWFTADTDSRLGGCLTTLGRYDQAEPLLLEGYQRLQAAAGTPPARRTQALERLVHCYDAAGQLEKAAAWRRKLEAEKGANKPGP